MRPYFGLVILLVPATTPAQPPAKYTDAIRALESLVERERRDAGIPGLSIALVQDQTVLWAKGFGHADLARTRPATPETVYRVGSVSKMFTDIAVMQLVDEGKIDIDAPVTKYLPDFKPANRFGKPITLRQLMSHRSGLVREPPAGSYFDPAPPSLEKTIASLNGVPLVYEPETRTKYSNAGVATVGLALERVDGRPFAKAVRERVLGPLGMSASDFEPTTAVKKDLAEGLMGTYHGREFRAPTFELGESPAACMYSTATDLARFVQVMLAGGKTRTGQLVRPETLKEMFRPQFAADGKVGFGLGFHLSDLDGHKRIGHGGAIYGFCTEVDFLPDEKLGVVVIANKDITDSVTGRLADAALRHLLAAQAGKPLPPVEEPKPLSRDTARKLAGTYGDRTTRHELIERQGKLYHLGPVSEYVAEVWRLGDELVEHGALGSGTHFTCDGETLTWPVPLGATFRRARTPDGPPAEPPAHFRGLIGEYGWDHDTLYIFEKDGKLHALIEWFFLYPLGQETEDVYAFPNRGLYHGEKLVFQRGRDGKATAVEAARVVFQRRPLDGEDGRTFRIKPLRPVEELRKAAAAATPPQEKGEFRKADLVELTALDPTIKTDLRYATDNNFLGTPLYPKTARAYMQRPAAEALVRVNKALADRGYGLLVFDSYRPWTVTKMFWDATPEAMRMFVADPSQGSRHNRGCAVDLTLYELKTGKPVEMVSGYDEFSDRAYPNYWGGTSRQRWHRELLRHAMEDGGFTVYEAEWWHFDFKDWRSYRIGNQGFAELGR